MYHVSNISFIFGNICHNHFKLFMQQEHTIDEFRCFKNLTLYIIKLNTLCIIEYSYIESIEVSSKSLEIS